VQEAGGGAAAREGFGGGAQSARGAATAVGVGDDRGAARDDGGERLLPDDVVLLLLRLRDARVGHSGGVCPGVRVLVLTTSYPRYEGDPTVNFLAEAVAKLRERGLEVDVVSPASFRHFGIAYGAGVMGNLRREPWRAALVPAMLANFRRAARGPAASADLIHAHWLPTGLVAASLGRPFVVQ